MLHHVFILLVPAIALAALSRQPLEKKPEEYQDSDCCWVSSINTCVPRGQAVPSPTACEQYRCRETEVVIESCGAVAVRPPCYPTTDLSLPYPKCCPNIVCPPDPEPGPAGTANLGDSDACADTM